LNDSFSGLSMLGLKLFSFNAGIPHSMPVLLLRFPLRNCCDFDGFTFVCYLFFLSYSLQYFFSIKSSLI
jgi:hypothetical protein